jgi:hypothetical protein
MSALPERYQSYAHLGQPAVQPREVELYDDRDPIVWTPNAYGEMVQMRRSQLPAYTPAAPPRDLTPQPLFDPQAQRLLAGGIGVGAAGAGLGFGAGQMLAGVAMMGTSGLAILLGLLLAAGALRRRPDVSIHQEVHQHARWFGKNEATM